MEWLLAHWEALSAVFFTLAGVFGWRVQKARKAERAIQAALAAIEAESKAKLAAIPRRCDTCANWDWEEGQAELRSNPRFWNEVAPHVSPQRMMERYDENGDLIPNPLKVLAKENTWAAFGYCKANSNLTHCSYHCGAHPCAAYTNDDGTQSGGEACDLWEAKKQ